MDCRKTAVTKTEHTYGNRGLSLESPSFTASSHSGWHLCMDIRGPQRSKGERLWTLCIEAWKWKAEFSSTQLWSKVLLVVSWVSDIDNLFSRGKGKGDLGARGAGVEGLVCGTEQFSLCSSHFKKRFLDPYWYTPLSSSWWFSSFVSEILNSLAQKKI